MAEEPTVTPEQQNEILFMHLVMMFKESAYQGMGKVMNPATNKVERNLAQAKQFIDVLGMLEAKTKGNLAEHEQRLLEATLTEVRMNYVDEVNKGETEGQTEDRQAATEDGESTSDSDAGEGTDADPASDAGNEETESGEEGEKGTEA